MFRKRLDLEEFHSTKTSEIIPKGEKWYGNILGKVSENPEISRVSDKRTILEIGE